MKPKLIIFLSLLFAVGLFLFLFREQFVYSLFTPRTVKHSGEASPENTITDGEDVEVVTQNLKIPWEIASLPTGDMLVTDRSGKLLQVGKETKVIKEIEGVKHIGEGGLLGLTLHPKFSSNNFIYLYSTTQDSRGITNRIERYKFSGNSLTDRKTILEGIKGSSNHDGGRMAFGPDGYLYITTGDAENSSLAQDKTSLNGKILRIKDDGGIPSDNPFGNAVYSLGHRNPQGLAWDKNGNLWETEHGPSGAQTGNDEVNLIVKGGNYGWPLIKGSQARNGLISPVLESGSEDTWAPAGLVILGDNLIFTGLRGETLYQAKIESGNKLKLTRHLRQQFGRLRAVILGPDGFIYVSTSNTDGRGKPKTGDDKIIKINPRIFK
jgi:glucose/arabinose dehydrogenase